MPGKGNKKGIELQGQKCQQDRSLSHCQVYANKISGSMQYWRTKKTKNSCRKKHRKLERSTRDKKAFPALGNAGRPDSSATVSQQGA